MKYTKKQLKRAIKLAGLDKSFLPFLDQAVKDLEQKWSCDTCIHMLVNPFDQSFCRRDYDLENGHDCKGKEFEGING